jgi:hypothetical protein
MKVRYKHYCGKVWNAGARPSASMFLTVGVATLALAFASYSS